MKTILTLPDGSAIDAAYVGAITWDQSRPGDYGSPAYLRVHTIREPSGFGIGSRPQLEQLHYLKMENDKAARETCEALVRAWTGKVFKPESEAQ